MGKEEDPTWVGISKLGKQMYIFADEASTTQLNFLDTFNTERNATVNELPDGITLINEQYATMMELADDVVPDFRFDDN